MVILKLSRPFLILSWQRPCDVTCRQVGRAVASLWPLWSLGRTPNSPEFPRNSSSECLPLPLNSSFASELKEPHLLLLLIPTPSSPRGQGEGWTAWASTHKACPPFTSVCSHTPTEFDTNSRVRTHTHTLTHYVPYMPRPTQRIFSPRWRLRLTVATLWLWLQKQDRVSFLLQLCHFTMEGSEVVSDARKATPLTDSLQVSSVKWKGEKVDGGKLERPDFP